MARLIFRLTIFLLSGLFGFLIGVSVAVALTGMPWRYTIVPACLGLVAAGLYAARCDISEAFNDEEAPQ